MISLPKNWKGLRDLTIGDFYPADKNGALLTLLPPFLQYYTVFLRFCQGLKSVYAI